MIIINPYNLTPNQKINFMDRRFELERFESTDFGGEYKNQMWFLTLHSGCQDIDLFMRVLEHFKDRFQREPYSPKAIISVENTLDGGYLHIHGVVKFKQDAFETVRKLVPHMDYQVRPEDLMRSRILHLWKESCDRFKVKCSIRNSDKSRCLERGGQKELRDYILKLAKHGVSTKAHGLIFKRVNLNKPRGQNGDDGLFTNRDEKPSRHHSPPVLTKMFDQLYAGV